MHTHWSASRGPKQALSAPPVRSLEFILFGRARLVDVSEHRRYPLAPALGRRLEYARSGGCMLDPSARTCHFLVDV